MVSKNNYEGMPLIAEKWQTMLRDTVLRDPARVADVSAALWRGLAHHLTAIIGERGFASLYARSVYQVSSNYPWLAGQAQPLDGVPFIELHQRLQAQLMPVAGQASVALLSVFIDTLTLLIGELVTASILHAAWGDEAVSPAETESKK